MGKSLTNSQHLDTGNFTSASESFPEVELSHVHLNWSYYILAMREMFCLGKLLSSGKL